MTMSLLNLFSGSSPEKLEQKGDALFDAKLWGQAKQAYDRAFHKLERRDGQNAVDKERISHKIRQTREALAREHQQAAVNYLEGGHVDEARNMLDLAMEITADDQFKQELKDQLHGIELRQNHEINKKVPNIINDQEEIDDTTEEITDDDYFHALCGTLPQEVQDAYLEYDEDFKTGYIALNRGDFQTAALSLSRAMENNPRPDSYIPLELAAAYLNLGRLTESQELLESFLQHHPDALPAYQFLCEIYWERRDFHRADTLLASIPDEFAESVAIVLLKGETLYQAENYEAARDYYHDFLNTYGWNDTVATELAKVYEALDEPDRARDIYKEMMDRCNSCRTRIAPMIKHRYAELCFAVGMYGTEILELYISLAREVPDNAAHYFERISQIYTAQGNDSEAERFRSFSKRAEAERDY
jgi:tetratricopeptide (TPR) repeat protein